MFKTRYNPKLKNTKFESSEDAIKRGVTVQTSFLSAKEIKAKLAHLAKLKETETPQNIGNDCYDADTFRQMQAIQFIQAKR